MSGLPVDALAERGTVARAAAAVAVGVGGLLEGTALRARGAQAALLGAQSGRGGDGWRDALGEASLAAPPPAAPLLALGKDKPTAHGALRFPGVHRAPAKWARVPHNGDGATLLLTRGDARARGGAPLCRDPSSSSP